MIDTLPCGSTDLAQVRSTLLQRALAIAGRSDRAGLTQLAQQSHRLFETWWQAARAVEDGPIDVIDFFSGCGGMSAGFRAINGLVPAFRSILAVDIDEVANDTYARNLSVRPINADVAYLARNLPAVDRMIESSQRRPNNPLVMIGCAPCQGFSSHRNASGSADERNALFIDFAKIAVYLAPEFVVIENVPEICTDRHWPHVQAARDLLEAGGYRVHLSVHNFAEFGLPQERFRAVMLASRTPYEAPRGYLSRSQFATVRQAISHLPSIEPGVADPKDPMHLSAGHRQSTIDTIRRVPHDGGRRPFDAGPKSLIDLQERQGKPGYEDVYGRLHWNRPAITITHYSRNPASGRFVHPEQDRGLSVREAALLQGFPSDFAFSGGFDDRFRQIGNAVPPVVAAHLALSLLRDLLVPAPSGPGLGVIEPLARSFSRLMPALKARSGVSAHIAE